MSCGNFGGLAFGCSDLNFNGSERQTRTGREKMLVHVRCLPNKMPCCVTASRASLPRAAVTCQVQGALSNTTAGEILKTLKTYY